MIGVEDMKQRTDSFEEKHPMVERQLFNFVIDTDVEFLNLGGQ